MTTDGTPDSFTTARESASPSTTTTSPARTTEPLRRTTKPFPAALREQIQVYLEEQIYLPALNLITNTLVAGQSSSSSTPAYHVPPSFLALTATLLVHPTYTTRATSDHATLPSLCAQTLQASLDVLGPHAITPALHFHPAHRNTARKRRADSQDTTSSNEDHIDHFLAKDGALWTVTESFWDVVGWAFNCSVRYPARWEVWRVWLEWMCDVLDADWEERARLDAVGQQQDLGDGSQGMSMRKDCLLLRYLTLGGRTHTWRRVVRSIFADGSGDCLRSFPEIFHQETSMTMSVKRKRNGSEMIDVENERYGDYDNEDDFGCSGTTKQDVLTSSFATDTPDSSDEENSSKRQALSPVERLGGSASLRLRIRLLALLSRASYHFPDHTCPISDLYAIMHESLRSLPVASFALFLAPTVLSTPRHKLMPESMLISLSQLCLNRLLPANAPDSSQENDDLTEPGLIRCFLPFAACGSSIDDNAKVAILLETLLRVFAVNMEVRSIDALKTAYLKGLEKRQTKIRAAQKKRRDGSDREKDMLLVADSEARVRMLFDLMKQRQVAA